MEKILLYNPAISTMNTGDEIISDSAVSYIKEMFPRAFYTQISTHLPVSMRYMYYLRDFDYRFVCGTNLLKGNMLLGFRQWDISLLKAPFVGKSILIGCGWWQYQKYVDLYSQALLKAVMSKEYIHSVRDKYTQEKLKNIGIRNVINTGCPTMWRFSEEFCSDIPVEKANTVVTTLTDYNRDIQKDTEMIDFLSKNYESVYLWIQGVNDYSYYEELQKAAWKNIVIVNPGLENYDALLNAEDIEYVGTRLHAGIRALQHKKRTIILAVDNRAIEKKKDFCLPVLPRENIDELKHVTLCKRNTDIHIPKKEIESFLAQFRK